MNFFEIFPTPKFLKLEYAGLSLTDGSISLISFAKNKKRERFLKSYGRQEIPKEILEDGEIKKPEELLKILSDFRKKYSLHYVKSSISEEKSFMFETTLPKMSREDIKSALKFKIEESVPIPADEAIYDFQIMPKPVGAEEQKIVTTVFPRNIIQESLDIFKKSGLNPLSFETESQAITRAVIKIGKNEPTLIVKAEKEKIALYLVEKGIVRYTSAIDNSHQNSSAKSETENKKPERVLENEVKIYTYDQNQTPLLKDSIDKLLTYWDSLNQDRPESEFKIKKILACGAESANPNFKNEFTEYFSVPIELADVWTNAFPTDKYIPEISFEESLSYAAAIGSALPSKYN